MHQGHTHAHLMTFKRLLSTIKIYTKTGDKGTTFLNSQTGRLPKSLQIFNVLGDTDELSSYLSVAKEHCKGIPNVYDTIAVIQHRLQDINSLLATPTDKLTISVSKVLRDETLTLEKRIDELTVDLDPLRNFIIPSGGMAASHLHFSRAICRRAERSLCAYYNQINENNEQVPLMFINRLSDYLFTAARYCAKIQGHPETPYSSRQKQ